MWNLSFLKAVTVPFDDEIKVPECDPTNLCERCFLRDSILEVGAVDEWFARSELASGIESKEANGSYQHEYGL